MSRRLRIEFHPAAEAELLEAAEWYRERSGKAGAAFRREVERGVTRIAAAPERWFPFALIYRVRGGAVAHVARRPGYWRSRV